MKLAMHSQQFDPIRIHLSCKFKEVLLAITLTLIPYAVAAIAVFAHHRQWIM